MAGLDDHAKHVGQERLVFLGQLGIGLGLGQAERRKELRQVGGVGAE